MVSGINICGERGIGGSAGISKYKAEVKGGLYGSNGMYGGEAEGKATMMSGNAEGHIGKEGMIYHKSEVSGDIAYCKAYSDCLDIIIVVPFL